MDDFKVVGKSHPRLESAAKVTGQAKYVDDYVLPHMVYGMILRSPYAHARVKSIDKTRAEKVPGVLKVLLPEDMPDKLFNCSGNPPSPLLIEDERILTDHPLYMGDRIAAVAAVTKEACREALDELIIEYEELPALFDVDDALKEDAPLLHPEKLYLELGELVGKLLTFSLEYHPKDIVKYDHDDLYFTFYTLSAQLKELLETVIPSRCVAIPLERTRETLYVGRIEDERLLKEAAFYLAVRAQMPESKLIEGVPRVVKIASRDVIDSVIGSALPGVVLTYTNPPPAPIPSRVGFKYFQLDSIGPYWNGISGSKVISVYVPSEIPDEKLELYAVKP